MSSEYKTINADEARALSEANKTPVDAELWETVMVSITAASSSGERSVQSVVISAGKNTSLVVELENLGFVCTWNRSRDEQGTLQYRLDVSW